MTLNVGGAAWVFSNELSDLLNGTICDGIRLTSVVSTEAGLARATVAYKIQADDLESPRGIPVTLGSKAATGYLDPSFRLSADASGQYLTVISSTIAYYFDSELAKPLLHYDYEREKADQYPEAHLQVHGGSSAWDALLESRGRPLHKLHLPVGGRRYRPTLEDVIEFLITEGLADSRAGWRECIEAGRERFRKTQLRAAVVRDPATAIQALKDHRLLDDV